MTEEALAMLAVWSRCRRVPGGVVAARGMGVIRLPDTPGALPCAGGVLDQPACVMRSLVVMDAAAAALAREGD